MLFLSPLGLTFEQNFVSGSGIGGARVSAVLLPAASGVGARSARTAGPGAAGGGRERTQKSFDKTTLVKYTNIEKTGTR